MEEICVEYNEVSLWWKNVRAILTESTKPFNAFTAALACRAIVVTLEKYNERLQSQKIAKLESNRDEEGNVKNGNGVTKIGVLESDKPSDVTPDDETYSSISEWENVSNDTCQFALLIGNLEDIAILSAIVKCVSLDVRTRIEVYVYHNSLLSYVITDLILLLSSQRVAPDETTRFFALPFARNDISLASILSRGRGNYSNSLV